MPFTIRIYWLFLLLNAWLLMLVMGALGQRWSYLLSVVVCWLVGFLVSR